MSISAPIIIPLNSAGISAAKTGSLKRRTFLSKYIEIAASSVAIDPRIISSGPS